MSLYLMLIMWRGKERGGGSSGSKGELESFDPTIVMLPCWRFLQTDVMWGGRGGNTGNERKNKTFDMKKVKFFMGNFIYSFKWFFKNIATAFYIIIFKTGSNFLI